MYLSLCYVTCDAMSQCQSMAVNILRECSYLRRCCLRQDYLHLFCLLTSQHKAQTASPISYHLLDCLTGTSLSAAQNLRCMNPPAYIGD